MKNVKMKGTGMYVPENKVYNDELAEHFDKMGLDARNLMEHLGRRKRYFISEGENTITMCQHALENCIQKHDIQLEDIEMVIVCTDTPEYLVPCNAIKLTGIYGERLKNVKLAFDLNSNCASMVQALDIASKYMKSSNLSNALILGSFCISPIAIWSDTVVYATFGDAAACVALTCEENEKESGFLDTEVYVDASYHNYITYPECGMANVPLKAIQPNQKRLEWNPFSMDFIPEQWCKMITKVLQRNSLEANDIDYYIFSQLSNAYNVETLRLLDVSEEKYHFVGTEYGYTGNTCPILCLNRMWNLYSKPGNRIIICTIGTGYSIIVQLYEF